MACSTRLALVTVLALAWLLALAAHAQAAELVIDAPTLVEGGAEVTLVIRSSSASGQVDRGLTVSVTAGEVSEERSAGRALELSYRAPRVATSVDVTLHAARRGSTVAETTITVHPPEHDVVQRRSGRPLDLMVPEHLILGQHLGAELSVRAAAIDAVTWVASAGTLSVIGVEDGRLRAHFEPPPQRFPRPVVVLVIGSDGSVDWATIPLWGSPQVETKTSPGALVRVEVEATSYGPFTADRAGVAQVTVAVPPNVTRATVHSVHGGHAVSKIVSLHTPVVPALAVACVASEQQLWIANANGDGVLEDAELLVHAAGARVAPARRIARGIYVHAVDAAGHGAVTLVEVRRSEHEAPSSCRLAARPAPPTPVPAIPSAKPRRWLGVGLQGGVITNFGSIVAPLVTAQFTARIPVLGDRLVAGVSSGFFGSKLATTTASEEVGASVWGVPVLARLAYELPVDVVIPFVAAQGGFVVVGSSLDAPSMGRSLRTDLRFAFAGVVGASTRLGPGDALVEASYTYATLNNDIMQGQLGGLGITGGYRYEF